MDGLESAVFRLNSNFGKKGRDFEVKFKGIRDYERIDTESKQYYKMYKSGRSWVYAGLLTTFFVTLPILNSRAAKADTTATDTTKATVVTGSSASDAPTMAK